MPGSRGYVQLLGVHHRTLLLAAYGRGVCERLARGQEGQGVVCCSERADAAVYAGAVRVRNRPEVQRDASRLGELFSAGDAQCRLSRRDEPRVPTASSVVGAKERQQGLGLTMPGPPPARQARADRPSPGSQASTYLVGERVSFGPRAG